MDDGVMSESSLEHSTRIAVLVVEDDPAMRAVLSDHLTRDGFDVVEEATAEGAIGLIETATIDAAVVDKEMPGVGGLDLLSFLRHRCPRMPVIIVTAFGGSHVAQEVFQRGASRYLEKPFRISDLVAALRTMTDSLRPVDTPPSSVESSRTAPRASDSVPAQCTAQGSCLDCSASAVAPSRSSPWSSS
jgi:DNA-binding response OmpR family regulator